MLQAYKYRIFPNKEQQAVLIKHFGHARHVYNWALDKKIKFYNETQKNLSRRELQDQLVAMKRDEKVWLNEVNSQSLLAALFNLDQAFKNFFEKRAKFPVAKRKYNGHQSFQCPQHVSLDEKTGLMHLPKQKSIKIKLHRTFCGTIKTVTISKVPSGKYYASILVEDGKSLPVCSVVEPDKTKGLDMGLSHYLIDSSGNKKEHPCHLRNTLSKLAICQRQLARKKKCSVAKSNTDALETHKHEKSKNYSKQRTRLSIIHEKVAHRRHDFVHQLSAKLVFKNHETSFAIEDLHIKGMLKNRKLSRAISDSGWRKFIQALTYKCRWVGKNVLMINRFLPSSKVCHHCLLKREKLPLSVREWQCLGCNRWLDRDINAAIMIKLFALADALGFSVCVKQSLYSNDSQRSRYSERSSAYH